MKKLLIILILISIHGFAFARVRNEPSYEGLEKVATLIVVAKPIETKATKKEINLPGISSVDQNGKAHSVRAIGVETKFKVSNVFKGKDLKEITLIYYQGKKEPGRGSPTPVQFTPGNCHSYLLFLKESKSGLYEPAGSITDPSDSIKELSCM